MNLPVAISNILHKLQNSGFAAYVVGGSVRDYFLGRSQHDYDIATSATPEQVIELFPKTIPTGIKHGTVTVIEGDVHCEVTTFRFDFDYDGRRPGYVKYATNIEDDLLRRDFTMNAIAFDGRCFIDPFGGIADIKLKVIRAVGEAKTRFQEDQLRMLRAVRFAAQLGFVIEEHTKQAIREQAHSITNVSTERIRDEITKMLQSNGPVVGITYLRELQLLKPLLPEIDALDDEKFQQMLKLLECTKANLVNRLCALFYFVDDIQRILRRLKYDRKTMQKVERIHQHRNVNVSKLTKYRIKKLIQSIDYDGVEVLFELLPIVDHVKMNPELKEIYEKVFFTLKEIKQNQEPIFIQDLAISGRDVISLGFQEGEMVGYVLKNLLELVLIKPECNEKEQLLRFAQQIKKREKVQRSKI